MQHMISRLLGRGVIPPHRALSMVFKAMSDVVYDVIVVGGGHAGTEAAAAAARMGCNTLLLTHKLETVGEMSCNPSFGGVGKGHLMREVDALDGLCARICDVSGINFRVLNKSKGPAVWGPRAQIDRKVYKARLQEELFSLPNLHVAAAPVEDLLLDDTAVSAGETSSCRGVVLADGSCVAAANVVLTTGTFLRGEIHLGLDVRPAGRLGDQPAVGLAHTLDRCGFRLRRLKTGTPPRLLRHTIDYTGLEAHPPDDPPTPFSFMNDEVWLPADQQVPCYLTHTVPEVGDIIKNNLHLNHHVKEEITGPRHCPSIESKYLRFSAQVHQVWLEPEGLDSELVYPQGLSCTLPPDLQQQLVNLIPGLHHAQVVQPGYGVEYDFVDPRQLRPSLETTLVGGLFLAGQINGTTGYEEAAAQGVIAGINAARRHSGLEPFTVSRTDGYIGVLIDDLTTLGTNEPYRMFTSRAEFRVSLRPDNADRRLTEAGYNAGCVSQERLDRSTSRWQHVTHALDLLGDMRRPRSAWLERTLGRRGEAGRDVTGLQILCDQEVTPALLAQAYPQELACLSEPRLAEQVQIEAIYMHAELQQRRHVEEIRRNEMLRLPPDLDYCSMRALSLSAREILTLARPLTLAAASRLQGVDPASLTTLLAHVKRHSSPLPQHSSPPPHS